MKDKLQILKVLVGSRAHGIYTEDSDHDFRGIYIEPTSKLVEIGYKSKGVSWVEGETEDQTAYELATYINAVLHGKPNELEILVAPIITSTEDGAELRSLFPDIWEPEAVYRSFTNYANNRRKNIFTAENKHVGVKSGYCAIRVLFNLCNLLEYGQFSLKVEDRYAWAILSDIKSGGWSTGEMIDYSYDLEETAQTLLENCKHTNNPDKVMDFYMRMRKKYWEI